MRFQGVSEKHWWWKYSKATLGHAFMMFFLVSHFGAPFGNPASIPTWASTYQVSWVYIEASGNGKHIVKATDGGESSVIICTHQ